MKPSATSASFIVSLISCEGWVMSNSQTFSRQLPFPDAAFPAHSFPSLPLFRCCFGLGAAFGEATDAFGEAFFTQAGFFSVAIPSAKSDASSEIAAFARFCSEERAAFFVRTLHFFPAGFSIMNAKISVCS